MSKKFIVTGIQMKNRGSQAMLVATIDGLKRLYPDCEVVCFVFKKDDMGYHCNYKLLPWTRKVRYALFFRVTKVPVIRDIIGKMCNYSLMEIENELHNSDAVFDASGYTLGTAWTIGANLDYIISINIAKRFGKKVFILPQSFGPFDKCRNPILCSMIARTLQKVEFICSREKDGVNELKKIGVCDVVESMDLVIRDIEFGSCNFVDVEESVDYGIYSNYVGVIINENLFRRSDVDVYVIFAKCIRSLLKKNVPVLIIKTSDKDDLYLNHLKEILIHDRGITWLTDALNCIQLEKLIGSLRFVVSSRYHAMVFALRNGVPAIGLGWSAKYSELLKCFDLEKFSLDISNIEFETVEKIIDEMIDNDNYIRTKVTKKSMETKVDLFEDLLVKYD